MMKKLPTILLLLFSINISLAQKQGNIWYFGDSAGINFNSGIPVAITDGILNSLEAGSSVADSNGNILFYTGAKDNNNNLSGMRIWNSQNNLMLNGDSINGDCSITQGALIIPFPDNFNKYFLFSIGDIFPIAANDLFYSIIDMNMNGGLGGVIQKNILLLDTVTEKMVAVKHGNGRDWWLIAHKLGSNEFIKYLVDSNGIHGPFLQGIGSVLGSFEQFGQIVVSQDGTKLCNAVSTNFLEIFNFDRCTGTLNNCINISYTPNFPNGFYGCSFSPNGKVLYISDRDSLFQFDLTSGNIAGTKQIIFITPNPNVEIGQHKIGPDNKIYISNNNDLGQTDSLNLHLSIIENPDILGVGCNFSPYSFYLGDKSTYYGLPNNPNYKLGASLTIDSAKAGNDTIICQGQIVVLGSPAHYGCVYSWSPGIGLDDSTKAQPFTTPINSITYTLKLTDTNNIDCKLIAITYDSVTVNVIPMVSANAGNNEVICLGDTILLGSPSTSGYIYNWKPSITLNDSSKAQPLAFPKSSTTYFLTMIDTANNECKNISTTSKITISVNDCYINRIYPNPNNGNFTIEYNLQSAGTFNLYDILGQLVFRDILPGVTGKQNINILNLNSGIYFWEIATGSRVAANGKVAIMR